MATLIKQLEDAGFDTTGLDEGKILQQLDQAGYDTSSLKEEPINTQPTEMDQKIQPGETRTRKFIRKAANALPTVGGIAGGVALGVPGTVFGMGVGGVPSAAAGAGLGAAGGEAAKELILRALGDTEGVPQSSLEAAKKIGITGAKDAALTYAGGKAFQGAGALMKGTGKLLFAPSAAEVGQAGKEALVEIGEKGAEKLGLAREVAEAAKKGLIGAEEKAGLHFQSTPEFESFIKDPEKMAKFSTKISRLSKLTPQELAQEVDPQTLQTFRKIAQEGEKISNLSDIAKAQLRQGKDIMTRALGEAEPEIGQQLGRFREAEQVAKGIPGEIKEKLAASKMKTAKDVLSAKDIEKKRKLVKSALAGAGAYIGLKKIFK